MDYITDALTAGIIWPSSSPLGAGFFFVEKKDKSLRPCIDFWGLNHITVKNSLISSAFESLQGATVFSKLDLRNAYHLVHIWEEDEWKTTFNTPLRYWDTEYLVMPFGHTNALSLFLALVNNVLRFLEQVCFCLLGWHSVFFFFSKTIDEHVYNVHQVLHFWKISFMWKQKSVNFHVDLVSCGPLLPTRKNSSISLGLPFFMDGS